MDLKGIINEIDKMKNIEGFVLRFEDDFSMFKVKSDWLILNLNNIFQVIIKNKKRYKKYHENKNKINEIFKNEKEIWKMILENSIEEEISLLNDTELKNKLEKFNIEFWEKVNKKSEYLLQSSTYIYLKIDENIEKFNWNSKKIRDKHTNLENKIIKQYRSFKKDMIDVIIEVINESLDNSSKSSIDKKVLEFLGLNDNFCLVKSDSVKIKVKNDFKNNIIPSDVFFFLIFKVG
jgi:hypothetical protein